jgi:DNA-binding NtrC family response regulator
MVNFQKIIIFDDDEYILKQFSKYLTKKYVSLKVSTYSKFSEEALQEISSDDFVILDYYLQTNIHCPDIVKKIKNKSKEIFVLCTSSAFVIENDKAVVVNKGIMKDCLNSGANRVCRKDIHEIIDILETHEYIRSSSRCTETI